MQIRRARRRATVRGRHSRVVRGRKGHASGPPGIRFFDPFPRDMYSPESVIPYCHPDSLLNHFREKAPLNRGARRRPETTVGKPRSLVQIPLLKILNARCLYFNSKLEFLNYFNTKLLQALGLGKVDGVQNQIILPCSAIFAFW